jgi:hypothetical protein
MFCLSQLIEIITSETSPSRCAEIHKSPIISDRVTEVVESWKPVVTPQVRGCYGTEGLRVEISIGGSVATAPTRTFRLLNGRRTIGGVACSCRQFQRSTDVVVVNSRICSAWQGFQLGITAQCLHPASEQRSSSRRTRLAQEPAAERDRPV